MIMIFKRLLLVFILATIVVLVGTVKADDGVVISEDTFPDRNFRAYVEDNIDDGNGVLTQDEIDAIESIDVSNSGIESLQGIEYFTSLTNLNCGYNQLTNLDVSHNTALIDLYCNGNQLTSLDVSHNTALTVLICSANQLTSLDVSHNTALTRLACSLNQLTNLDVSHNTALTRLYCSFNQLTSLDLTNNATLLAEIAEYDAYVDGGGIQVGARVEDEDEFNWNPLVFEVDTTVNVIPEGTIQEPAIIINEISFPDDTFRAYVEENIDDGDGLLTQDEIDAVKSVVVNRRRITSLQGIEYFTALTELKCNQNNLTSLDVSQNTALTELDCGSNQLTSLNVSQNTALTSLGCGSNQLTDLDVSQNTALTELDCSSSQLTNLDVRHNTALTVLNCNNNQLTSLDVSGCTALTRLKCYGNQLTSLDVSQNTALTDLDCYNNQLTVNSPFDLSTLPDSFDVAKTSNWRNGTIEGSVLTATAHRVTYTYDCGNNHTMTVRLIAENVFNSVVAATINEDTFPDNIFRAYVEENIDDGDGVLTQDEIDAVDSIELFGSSIGSLQGIEYFTALEELHCSSNKLTSLDVSSCTALTTLSCYNNQLTSLDVSSCTALTRLDCRSNQLTSLDVSHNTALTRLDCWSNQLTSLDVSHNTALTKLWCYSNQLTSLDVSCNTALTELECQFNQLTNLDVSHNTELTSLYCQVNQLTSLDVSHNTVLTTLVCSGNQLTSLDVSHNTALERLSCDSNQLTSLDVGQNMALTNLYSASNQLSIISPFDLSALPGSFDISKTSNWQGGSVDATVLTATADRVTYDYDCGYKEPMQVTLRVVKLTFILPSSTTTIEKQAFEGIKDKVFQIPATVTSIADGAFDPSAIVIVETGSYAEKRCLELGLRVYVKK